MRNSNHHSAVLTFWLFTTGVILGAPPALRAADSAVALRERYLGPTGLPSETAYAQSHGILPAPGTETFDWRAVFKLTYRTADLPRLNEAHPVLTDCYFVRTRKYVSPNQVQPVWDGRAYAMDDRLVVAAYTQKGERVVGQIDEQSSVVLDKNTDESIGRPDLEGVQYNPFTGQLWRRAPGGDIREQQRLYMPLALVNRQGKTAYPELKVIETKGNQFSLVAGSGDRQLTLATCALENGKYAKRSSGFSPGLGPGCSMVVNEPTTVFEIPGEIATDVLDTHLSQLVLRRDIPPSQPSRASLKIDGRFDEWRNVRGVSDPEGDIVSYLQYNPDTDLLEFKVANDGEYLYFYTRVAGQHGNTANGRDRYYFYVYIDADRDPTTGYVPSRDDDCYYGVTLGDDCEAQFEFIGGQFVKTFFGFAGRSTEKDVLSGRVTLGPSWYNRHDEQGRLRDGYKVEYIRRADEIRITEDFSEGTSDDIGVALSPDGSECEMRARMSGFLQNADGNRIIAPGQRIDLAAGVEASGQARGNSKWGADSTVIVRGYSIAK
jgi:hypothetical protein